MRWGWRDGHFQKDNFSEVIPDSLLEVFNVLLLIVDLLHGLAEVGLQLVMRIVHLKTHS